MIMKKIYILDEFISSQKNGIGTFLKQLIQCFKKEWSVCIVSFNANIKEFTIRTDSQGIEWMMFPEFYCGNFTQNGDVVCRFFDMYISDSEENLFIVNHSPCSNLLCELKRTLPLSRIMFVIHDLGWTAALWGDVVRYKWIIHNNMRESVQKKYASIIQRYEEEKRIFDIADKVVCLSEDTYCLIQKVYKIDLSKLALIPNGLKRVTCHINDKENLKQELMLPPNERVLLFVGRATPQKGIHILLKAFEEIINKYVDLRLVIVGSYNEYLLKRNPKVATRVTFTGLLDKDWLHKWYRVADIGVIPSFYEQCPYNGIEMMMYGLPIVCTDGIGLRNMFQDGINAKVVSIGNRKNHKGVVNRLATSMSALLDSFSLCEHLSIQSKKVYQKEYNIETMRNKYRKLINEMI